MRRQNPLDNGSGKSTVALTDKSLENTFEKTPKTERAKLLSPES